MTRFPIVAKSTDGPIHARMGGIELSHIGPTPPTEIMWMPGGTHEITASRKGKPLTVTVTVDRKTAAVAQQALGALLAGGSQRPYFDFDHDNKAAAAWPVEFFWRNTPAPGVYARVEWTASGAAAIAGKEYRAFSPSFFVDDGRPALVTGSPINMGGLVNDPAFKAILPIWAKAAEQPVKMKKYKALQTLLATIAGLQTDNAALLAKSGADAAKPEDIAAKGAEIKAKLAEAQTLQEEIAVEASDSDQEEIAAAHQAEVDVLKARNAQLEADQVARRKADAQGAVDAAIARGAIAAQDTATQAKWLAILAKDAAAVDLLNGLAGSAALGSPIVPVNARAAGRVDVGREDVTFALKAYNAANEEQRGLIFKNDLSKRIKEDSRSVIRAANSLGTTVGELIVRQALGFLKYEYPMLGMISSNFGAQQADFGQTVKTRLITAPAVGDYSTSTGYTSDFATATDVSITINAHKHVSITFNANELAGAGNRDLFGENVEAMHSALGGAMVDALFALTTAGNYNAAGGTTTKALVSFARTDVTAMAKALNVRKVPRRGRMLALNNDYFEKLQADSTIVSLAAFQRPEVITDYTLPPIAGFQPFEAGYMPTTGNLTGFAFTPSSWAIATRTPSDYASALPGVPSTALVSTITNPDTGISVVLTQFVDHQLGQATCRIAIMYGVAVGDKNCAQRLISATP